MAADPSFSVGNAVTEGKRGWFVGQFLPAEAGLCSQSALEVKWGQHQKGECRVGFAAAQHGATISVLISGQFVLRLLVDGELREILMKEPGDYAIFAAHVPHSWEALADSLVISIRFPSLAGNQIELPDPFTPPVTKRRVSESD